jgi:hypothetical protein
MRQEFPGRSLIDNLAVNNQNLSGLNYQNAIMKGGQKLYVDRAFTVRGVPVFFKQPLDFDGATSIPYEEFIRSANNDRDSSGDDPFITFGVDRHVTVCVGHDNRITNKPDWLRSFNNTGKNIQTDIPESQGFGVFCQDFPPGTVDLGGNHAAGVVSGGRAMYVVVVLPQGIVPLP